MSNNKYGAYVLTPLPMAVDFENQFMKTVYPEMIKQDKLQRKADRINKKNSKKKFPFPKFNKIEDRQELDCDGDCDHCPKSDSPDLKQLTRKMLER